MGRLEAPRPVLDRAGEGAVHVPEQLALEQALAQRTAVDTYERSRGAIAQMVNAVAISSLPVPVSPNSRTEALLQPRAAWSDTRLPSPDWSR